MWFSKKSKARVIQTKQYWVEAQKLCISDWSIMGVVWGICDIHMYQGKSWTKRQSRVNGWTCWSTRRKMVAQSGARIKALNLKSETKH